MNSHHNKLACLIPALSNLRREPTLEGVLPLCSQDDFLEPRMVELGFCQFFCLKQ